MLFIAQILLVLLSIYVGYKVYCPFNVCVISKGVFETGSETGVTYREQISKMLDDKLKWILKKDLAKDLMTIVETFLMIIHRLELPKVEVELDDILQKILTDNAFYQTSTAVRVFKFLLGYFGLMLNSIVCGTIYWLLEYHRQLTRLILEDQISSFDHADMYEDRIIGLKSNFNEPSSEDAELRDLNIRRESHGSFINQNSRQMYYYQNNTTATNQFRSQAQINPVHRNSNPPRGYNSPATESTPMTSPENMGGNVQELEYDAYPMPLNTTGIIEVPFIGKSTENLNLGTTARFNSRRFVK